MQALEDCGIILLVEGSLYRPLGRIDFMGPPLLVAGAVFLGCPAAVRRAGTLLQFDIIEYLRNSYDKKYRDDIWIIEQAHSCTDTTDNHSCF